MKSKDTFLKIFIALLTVLSVVYVIFNYNNVNNVLLFNICAAIISLFSVLLVVEINALLSRKKILSSKITRKLVHIFVGFVFLISWLLFKPSSFNPFIAMSIPLLFALQFILVGTGVIEDEQFVDSMCRSGKPSELLKGTLYYALTITAISVFWFYSSPEINGGYSATALLVIGCLAGGDGFADIIGRKFGGDKTFGFGGSSKTLAGTLAMFIFSFLASFLLFYIYSLKIPLFNPFPLIIPIFITSFIATVIEALSPKGLDNVTISAGVIITAYIFSRFFQDIWNFSFSVFLR